MLEGSGDSGRRFSKAATPKLSLPVAEKVDNAAAYLRYGFGARAAELPDHALHRDCANRL